MEGPSWRRGAVTSIALVLSACLCYYSFSREGQQPAELVIRGSDGLPRDTGAAELSAYSGILSFGPEADPAARTTPGDDSTSLAEADTPLQDKDWARRYLRTGQLVSGHGGKSSASGSRGVDCYYTHPVDECDRQTSLSVRGQQGHVDQARSSGVVYDANCFYHHTVAFCESLRDRGQASAAPAQQAQARHAAVRAPAAEAPRGVGQTASGGAAQAPRAVEVVAPTAARQAAGGGKLGRAPARGGGEAEALRLAEQAFEAPRGGEGRRDDVGQAAPAPYRSISAVSQDATVAWDLATGITPIDAPEAANSPPRAQPPAGAGGGSGGERREVAALERAATRDGLTLVREAPREGERTARVQDLAASGGSVGGEGGVEGLLREEGRGEAAWDEANGVARVAPERQRSLGGGGAAAPAARALTPAPAAAPAAVAPPPIEAAAPAPAPDAGGRGGRGGGGQAVAAVPEQTEGGKSGGLSSGVVHMAKEEAHEIGAAGIAALGFKSKGRFERHLEKEGV